MPALQTIEVITMDILAQIVGILGTCAAFISFQLKENKKFFILQSTSGALFALNFLMLGAYTGSLLNLINIYRGAVMAGGKKTRKLFFLVSIQLLYIVATVFTYTNIFSLIALAAQLIGTFAMWSQNGKTIRILQLFAVSPMWLIHNIFVFSIGGIICEVFNIGSIIVSLIRFGFDGFERNM